MLEKFVKAARRDTKADLVLKNAKYLDVFCGKLREGDIAIVDDKIVGIGSYEGETELDCSSKIVLPAFIDGHVHIESSSLSPEEFASLIVPRGTTAVIADPHEIVNVLGMIGFDYILKASKSVPLDVFLNLPSCVPATPFETSGACLSGGDIEKSIVKKDVFGLGEFMNFPALINADPDALKKAEAAINAGKITDGHAPAVSGNDLNAYLCCGVSTDHECSDGEEIEEKLSKGMYIHIRHGSTTKNLGNARFMTAENARRFLLCTDDRHAADLKEYGHIDDALRRLVADGVDPVRAVTCATLNAAECYGLKRRGGIAPGWLADLVVVDDMREFKVRTVVKGGKVVAKDGAALFDVTKKYLPANILHTVHVRKLRPDDFAMPVKSDRAKAIKLIEGTILTDCEIVDIKRVDGDVDVKGSDLLKLAVVERHKMTGNIGKGLIKGYGFKGGAMGITVSHDSHNIILLGDDNAALAKAANRLREIGGGMVIVDGENVYSLALDIAGLMSSQSASDFCRDSRALIERAHDMGVKRGYEAFMSLAFLSLAVVPKLKLVDKGLFDVEKFAFTDIEA